MRRVNNMPIPLKLIRVISPEMERYEHLFCLVTDDGPKKKISAEFDILYNLNKIHFRCIGGKKIIFNK